MNLHLARSVGRLYHMLSELVAQALYFEDSECVLADSNEALVALCRAEWTHALQRFVADRSYSILA